MSLSNQMYYIAYVFYLCSLSLGQDQWNHSYLFHQSILCTHFYIQKLMSGGRLSIVVTSNII